MIKYNFCRLSKLPDEFSHRIDTFTTFFLFTGCLSLFPSISLSLVRSAIPAVHSELLLSCVPSFTGVPGASFASGFAGVAGMSPLRLSTPVTDIRLFRSLELDLCSTFVTLNLRWPKARFSCMSLDITTIILCSQDMDMHTFLDRRIPGPWSLSTHPHRPTFTSEQSSFLLPINTHCCWMTFSGTWFLKLSTDSMPLDK